MNRYTRKPREHDVSPHMGVRGCGGKRSYSSPGEAARMAKATRRQAEEGVEEYRCHHCGKWHVGESSRHRRIAMNTRKGIRT